jgi:ribosomal protein S18 acetylase RimI-like enzyme
VLSSKQLDEIRLLQKRCEDAEGFQLKLNWDMLRSRQENVQNDFLHYENEKLIGFIGLYGFGNKVELCGMVDPEFRRKGIFSQLFSSALAEMAPRKYRQVLLNAPASSVSAKGFLQTIPNEYSITEYQMKWNGSQIGDVKGVGLRPSTTNDVNLEVRLDVECFGFMEDEAKEYNNQIKKEGTNKFYTIEAEDVAVGKVRLDHTNGEAWIYGFAVLPSYQGKGIGRKALTKIISQEHQAGFSIFLEVEAKNAHALGLYESCGFRTYHAQDYYELKS